MGFYGCDLVVLVFGFFLNLKGTNSDYSQVRTKALGAQFSISTLQCFASNFFSKTITMQQSKSVSPHLYSKTTI